MKKLLILCLIIGLFAYFYKDGQQAEENVREAISEIGASLKGLF